MLARWSIRPGVMELPRSAAPESPAISSFIVYIHTRTLFLFLYTCALARAYTYSRLSLRGGYVQEKASEREGLEGPSRLIIDTMRLSHLVTRARAARRDHKRQCRAIGIVASEKRRVTTIPFDRAAIYGLAD